MTDFFFTGLGDAAADKAIVYRARAYDDLGPVQRRTDRTGEPLRRLSERVYTNNLRDRPDELLRRNAWLVLGKLYPGMVVSARSASAARPVASDEGGPAFVFLTGKYRRSVRLGGEEGGLEVRIAVGPGPLPGDLPLLGLHLASPARQCLENLFQSRDKGAGVLRTTGPAAVERYLVDVLKAQGEEGLNAIRDHARSIESALGAGPQFETLNGMMGAVIMKSRDAGLLTTPSARAVARGEGYDEGCVRSLDALFSFLASHPMPTRPDRGIGTPAATNTAFVEAYFSNYIEGTTFLVSEARDIVFSGGVPAGRPKDGHDVLATFKQLADYEGMRKTPDDFGAFVDLLKARHSLLMSERPEVGPGRFKESVNRAGNTVFVRPDQVMGTLRRGHEMLAGLSHPFARGVFAHFLVSAVHPFADGNGRISRIVMASELTAGGLARAVVPTVYRDDYLGGQRALSRKDDAGANFRALSRCQDVTSRIVEEDLDDCVSRWASTHAFLEPGAHAQFNDPDERPLVDRDGVLAPESFWSAQDTPSGISF